MVFSNLKDSVILILITAVVKRPEVDVGNVKHRAS